MADENVATGLANGRGDVLDPADVNTQEGFDASLAQAVERGKAGEPTSESKNEGGGIDLKRVAPGQIVAVPTPGDPSGRNVRESLEGGDAAVTAPQLDPDAVAANRALGLLDSATAEERRAAYDALPSTQARQQREEAQLEAEQARTAQGDIAIFREDFAAARYEGDEVAEEDAAYKLHKRNPQAFEDWVNDRIQDDLDELDEDELDDMTERGEKTYHEELRDRVLARENDEAIRVMQAELSRREAEHDTTRQQHFEAAVGFAGKQLGLDMSQAVEALKLAGETGLIDVDTVATGPHHDVLPQVAAAIGTVIEARQKQAQAALQSEILNAPTGDVAAALEAGNPASQGTRIEHYLGPNGEPKSVVIENGRIVPDPIQSMDVTRRVEEAFAPRKEKPADLWSLPPEQQAQALSESFENEESSTSVASGFTIGGSKDDPFGGRPVSFDEATEGPQRCAKQKLLEEARRPWPAY
jgi:hypothetical protein